MSQIIGLDHASQIISTLERRMNEKGIIVHSAASESDGTHLVAEGLGNKKRTTIIIEKLDAQPSDEEAVLLVQSYLSQIESGLRSAPTPVELDEWEGNE